MSTLRVNSFCSISSTHSKLYGTLSVLRFCRVNTMATPFLDHFVRDRDSIQSQFTKLSSGFDFNQELSASAIDNSLIPIKKSVRTLFFWYTFAQLEKLHITQFTDHLLRNVAERVVDVILLQVGLKWFSMRMTFDLLDEHLKSEMFCFFHNCM